MTDPDPRLIDALAAIIRKVDGNRKLGAAALAEAILCDFFVIDVQIAGGNAPTTTGELPMTKTLLCKDCKHFRRAPFLDEIDLISDYWDAAECIGVYAKCAHPDLIKTNPVDGRDEAFCESQRREIHETCGPDGKFWEPKKRANLIIDLK